jgi:hypothetical protein
MRPKEPNAILYPASSGVPYGLQLPRVHVER